MIQKKLSTVQNSGQGNVGSFTFQSMYPQYMAELVFRGFKNQMLSIGNDSPQMKQYL